MSIPQQATADITQPFLRGGIEHKWRDSVDPTVSSLKKKFCGWRITVLGGSVAAAIIFIINLVVLVWIVSSFPLSASVAKVFTGSCSKASNISLWSHLAINIVGTVLLAASNSCMQVLLAPTRAEIDNAHQRRQWLDLGSHTARNLRSVGGRKIFLWTLLGVSSLPLHLLYNSVVIKAPTVNIFETITVTKEFLNGMQLNLKEAACKSYKSLDGPNITLEMQRNATSNQYVRLEPEKCINAYARAQSKYAHVLLVTNETAESRVIRIRYRTGGSRLNSNSWVCDRLGVDPLGDCDTAALLAELRTNGWKTPGVRQRRNNTSTCREEPDHMFLVDHCLAMPTPEEHECTIYVGIPLLATVTLCNFVKLVCMLWTLLKLRFSPIITIGDAVDSFLREPDETTAGFALLEARDVGRWIKPGGPQGKPCVKKNRQAKHAISRCRWVCCNILFLATIIAAGVALAYALNGLRNLGLDVSLRSLWRLGLGKGVPDQRFSMERLGLDDRDPSIISEVLMTFAIVANLPQLVISILYILYNDIFTRMATAREWSLFYREDGTKIPLRVSRPTGLQRSTSFLQLPFWWAFPIMTAMTLLHWMVSQSLFFSVEHIRDYRNNSDELDLQGVAWSPLGIILSMLLGLIMVLGLWGAAFTIKLPGGMPMVRNCSAAISAACQRLDGNDDVAEKMISWGVISYQNSLCLES
ncbi:hypothetical protein Ct61P_15534 [Colletotrichum tofieldiae]|nr:hypothetical protein Ct61P_15534 [Colletotrichum tofieldiae]